jgi:hypothetical protein
VGVDFIGRVGRTYVKHIDGARARLGTSDLFTGTPEEDRPTYPIEIKRGAKLRTGQELTVEVSGESLVYRNVLSVVAQDDAPPADVLKAVRDSCGIATAIVHDVHELSSVVEVSFC